MKVSFNVRRNRKMKQSQVIAIRRQPKSNTILLCSKFEIGLVKCEKAFHKATLGSTVSNSIATLVAKKARAKSIW